MRNLKRALSLALASVMLVGMMVVGTSAASYPDVDSNDNVEAISVLQAVGVMQGDADTGEFRPDDKVSRNEMAVIMARLLLGSDADNYVGTHPFTDVPSWADKYVAACYNEGIIMGMDDTTYGGTSTITAEQAAAMMLRALGYEKLEGTGADWARPVVNKANSISLFKGLGGNVKAELTRNQIAQLSLNTLKGTCVDSDIEQDIIVEGVVTIPGKVTYTDRTTSDYDYTAPTGVYGGAAGTTGTLQLCEKLYEGKLVMTSNGTDDMNRPATTWSYKQETICKSANEPDWTTVVTKTNKTAAKLVEDHNSNWDVTTCDPDGGGSAAAGDVVTINGAAFDSSSDIGNLLVGDVVEVYLNPNVANQVKTIAVTRYTAGKVTGNVATKDDQVRVPGVVSSYTDMDKVVGYEDLAKDDIVYYYADKNTTYIFKADSFEGKLTGSKAAKDGTPAGFTIDGQTYYINGNKTTITDVNGTPVYNTQYEYFVDANGYLIDCKKIEDAKSDEYVVIDQIVYVAGDGSINGSKRVEAKLVKMDGTTEVVEINSVSLGTTPTKYIGTNSNDLTADTDTNNGAGGDKYLVQDRANASGTTTLGIVKSVDDKAKKAFFTYSEGSDGYDLTEVVDDDDITVGAITDIGDDANTKTPEIKNGAAKMNSNIAVNKNTVFVIAKDSSNTKDYVAYTGNNNVPDVRVDSTDAGFTAVVTKDGIATHVFVAQYQDASTGGDTIFILSATPDRYAVEKDSKDKDMKVLYYKAIVDGEESEVKVLATNSTTPNVTVAPAIGAFEPTYNDDGVIKALKADTDCQAVKAGYTMSAGTLKAGSAVYAADDAAPVYLVDDDLNVSATKAGELDKDDNDAVYVVTNKDGDVDYAVIFVKDENGKVVVKEESQSGSAATTSVTISTNENDKEQEVILTGTVVSGVKSDDSDATSMMGSSPTSNKGTPSKYTIVKFTLPSYLNGAKGVKQTNNALSEYYSGDGSVTGNVKLKAYSPALATGDTFCLMVLVGDTATLEFDLDYDGTEANFKADYTFTFDGTGLKAGS